MSLSEIIESDLKSIMHSGLQTDVRFMLKENATMINIAAIVNRRSQTFVPLSGMSEPLPVHSITVSNSDFTLKIPKNLRDIEVSWVDISGKSVNAIVNEMLPDYSLGRITFLCMKEFKA